MACLGNLETVVRLRTEIPLHWAWTDSNFSTEDAGLHRELSRRLELVIPRHRCGFGIDRYRIRGIVSREYRTEGRDRVGNMPEDAGFPGMDRAGNTEPRSAADTKARREGEGQWEVEAEAEGDDEVAIPFVDLNGTCERR